MDTKREIARDPGAYWDSTQETLSRRLREAVEDAFENMPGMSTLQFSHAAAVLRQYADDLEG